MGELRDRTGFAIEPVTELRIRRKSFGQDLDGDDAIEAAISCSIHLSHSARPKRGFDAIRTELRADAQRHASQSTISRQPSAMPRTGHVTAKQIPGLHCPLPVDEKVRILASRISWAWR
jgi:hypothetical protein